MDRDMFELIEEMGFTCRTSIPLEGYITILPNEILKIVENYSVDIYTDNFDNVIKNNYGKYILIRTLHNDSIQVNSLCVLDKYKIEYRQRFFPESIFIPTAISLESLKENDIEIFYDNDKITVNYYGIRESFLAKINIISIYILNVIPTKTRLGAFNHKMIMEKLK